MNLHPSPEEITEIIHQEIIKKQKKIDFNNFMLIFKEKNFDFFPYFSSIKAYVKKLNLSKNQIFQFMAKMEIAEQMLLEGATEYEIKNQTNIPDELLAIIFHKYYNQIPFDIIQVKLTHFRLMQLIINMESFYKQILEKYTPDDKKNFIDTFYHTIVDMIHLNEPFYRNSQLVANLLKEKNENIVKKINKFQ